MEKKNGLQQVVKTSDNNFTEQILADLTAQGLSGDELIKEFRKKQAQIRPAVEKMIEQAEKAAHEKGKYDTYDNIFSE